MLAAVLALTLSACGPQEPAATPTIDVTAVYTAAFQTFTAQQATQLALTPPTTMPTQTAAPTLGAQVTPAISSIPNTGSGTPGTTGGAQVCNNAVYVSDVTVPDGTVMTPGQNFVKTWTVKNAGTCPWTTAYKLVFVSGEAMGGISTPLTATVAAGQNGNASVALVAPSLGGAYTGSWRLQDASGTYFGDVITVVITVSGGAGAAPSATATP
jgi:hypothetical protein